MASPCIGDPVYELFFQAMASILNPDVFMYALIYKFRLEKWLSRYVCTVNFTCVRTFRRKRMVCACHRFGLFPMACTNHTLHEIFERS